MSVAVKTCAYRIMLEDASTGRRWDGVIDGAESRLDAIHEARRTFATHFVDYEGYCPGDGSKGIGSESDYMDELVRVGARFRLVACIASAAARPGFDPSATADDIAFEDAFMPARVPDAVLNGTVDTTRPLIVLVHPGSLMGSYAMHYEDAAEARETGGGLVMEPGELRTEVAGDVRAFPGDRAVVLGDFIDEISDDDDLRAAVDGVWRDGIVLYASQDDDQLRDAAAWLVRHARAVERPFVRLTGAWADADNGCVSAVAKDLAAAGATVEIAANAPWLDMPPALPTR